LDRAISLELRRIDLAIELPFQLGRARIDPPAHEITIAGKSARMQPQNMKVMVALHDKIGQVVTRDELVDRCWDGRIVGEDVINRCILLLRRFAAESGGFRIETVHRAGYRLVQREPSATKAVKLRWMAAVATLLVGVAGFAGWAWMDRPRASQGEPPTPSISVVPFAAEGNDPLARQIAAAAPLSISHMMADSGFAVVHGDPPAGSNAARSDYVFSGDVRRSGASVEATVQLVSGRDGTIAFAHDFSAPIARAADLPDRIGATVAAELAWTGAQMALDTREHLNPEITSELISAMALTIEHHDNLRAYQLARHAASSAPGSAFAQLTLAVQTDFSFSSIPQGERAGALELGRRAGDRALALAPEFGDVYLTWCLLHSPVRMTECDAHVRHALSVDWKSSFVPGYLSTLFHEAGLTDESLRLAEQSLANDPYKPAKMARMIEMLELSGDSDGAEQVYREARRLWPDSGSMRASRLVGMAERGNYAGLAAFVDPAADAHMLDIAPFSALLIAERKHDLAGARRACESDDPKWFTEAVCMTILAELGDRDRSFAIAAAFYPQWHAPPGEDADRFWIDHPDSANPALLNGPAAKAMRTDPRFLDLAQKLGLLTYWRSGRLPDFCTKAHEPVCAQILRRA
jgi:DNA-binding winged helix-turn-helix (wHTH) protein/TolB-like protein